LTSKQSFHPGEILNFELVLIGPAIEALPYFIHIFIEVGRRGLGRERGKYELLRVDLIQNDDSQRVYEADTRRLIAFPPQQGPVPLPGDDGVSTVTLQFLTPLRLKEKGDLTTRLTFPLLFANLARRLNLLAAFYGTNGAGADFYSLQDRTDAVTTKANGLHWHDWERYSRRQDSTMKFGGLTGTITFAGPLAPFLPYLRLGAAVNLGQATTFGLGRYTVEDL
jgi:hypothetical protein